MSIIEHNPTSSRLAPMPVRERIARAAPLSAPASSLRASSSADNASAARAAPLLPSRFEVLWEIGAGAIASLPGGIAVEKVVAAHVRWTIVRSGADLHETTISRHACIARCELVLTMKGDTMHTQTLHEGVLCVAHTSIDAPSLVSVESVERGLLSVVINAEQRANAESEPALAPLYARTSVLQGVLGLKGGVYDQPTIAVSV